MFGPKSKADTFYKWVRTGCHSLPPIFHTYSVWSGGVCPIGKINGRHYHFEIKWEKASFRDFTFDLIIAWNLPTRHCFQRLKKNYSYLKRYFWLRAELKSKPGSQTSSLSVCLILCSSSHFFPLVLSTSLLLHQFLLPAPLTALLSLQDVRTAQIFWGSRSTRPWQMLPCCPVG